MALMLAKTYGALVAAGAPEHKAREAAEEIAGLDQRLTRFEATTAATLVLVVAIAAGVATVLKIVLDMARQ